MWIVFVMGARISARWVVLALFLDPATIIKSDSFASRLASFCLKDVEAQIVFMMRNSFEIGVR